MKDIDFDELDRAVGTVLGAGASTQKDPDPVIAEPAVSVAVSPPEPKPITDAVIKPITSPARKRGQFLDMVHPSADMRGKNTMPMGVRKTIAPIGSPVPPTKPEDTPVVNDIADTIEPSSIEDVPTTDALAPVVPEAVEAPVDTADTPAELKESAPKSSWPDPIDFASDNGAESDTNSDAQQTTEEDQSSDATETASSSDDSSGQTPFVPGVEVEKRPLGSNQSGTMVLEPLPSAASLTSPDAASEEPEPAAAPSDAADSSADITGPELSEELNSIESNGINENEESTDTVPLPGAEPASASAPVPEKPVEQPVAAKPEPIAAPAEVPVGAQSIPQQYKPAEKKIDEDDDHPLFDTEEYHQPLLPSGKKKGGKPFLIIILFIILAIVGCALGYLAFTMGV